MKTKLVKTYSTCRIYELSEPIYKGKSDWVGEVNIMKSLNDLYERIKPEFKELALKDKKDGCYYVAISDAHTHIERLAFPAIKVGEDYTFICDDICGKHTSMSKGGDEESIYPDEVYLRRLAQLNGLKYDSGRI